VKIIYIFKLKLRIMDTVLKLQFDILSCTIKYLTK